jgi:hypothetical protein
MTFKDALLVLAILLWIVAHYGLAVVALRDLRSRPAATDNRVGSALLVLCLPIAGPLIYLYRAGPPPSRGIRTRTAARRASITDDSDELPRWS